MRTQTRPAIEFVSGEEGLRPKSYLIVFTFHEYVFMDNYHEMAPWLLLWSRGGRRDSAAGGHRSSRV